MMAVHDDSNQIAMERVLSIAGGLPRNRSNNRLMALFSAYVDDSGTHAGSRHFVLGGSFASVDEWLEFTEVWDKALEHYDLTWFHMTDAEGGFREFKRFTRRQRIEIIRNFATIVHGYSRFYFFTRVDSVVWNNVMVMQVVGEYPGYREIIKTAFLAAYDSIIHLLAEICHNKGIKTSDVELVFAKQENLGTPTRDGIWLPCEATGLNYPIFRNPKEFLPLQAADMYAWKENRYLNVAHGCVADRHMLLHGRERFKRDFSEPYIYELANQFRENGRRLASTYEWVRYLYPNFTMPVHKDIRGLIR
ncbi:MAG: DUF3800 domain-containing protein [Planctomycetes bacterium]|nr:DUF3800 domain-containing protein [Planctomycetota bacterium]